MAVRIAISSLHSSIIGISRSGGTTSVSTSRRSQYGVSRASLHAMLYFNRKSLRLWLAWPSSTFAPMDVPERISCRLNVCAGALMLFQRLAEFHNSLRKRESPFRQVSLHKQQINRECQGYTSYHSFLSHFTLPTSLFIHVQRRRTTRVERCSDG